MLNQARRPWWRSNRFRILGGYATFLFVFLGIPLVRTLAIEVPNPKDSNITIGQLLTYPVERGQGRYNGPKGGDLLIANANDSALWLSCRVPGFTSVSTCLENQGDFDLATVKVFWSEQPSGYIFGKENRPSRIEKVNGTVLFSEGNAKDLISSQVGGHLFVGWLLLLMGALLYLPLVWIADRSEKIG